MDSERFDDIVKSLVSGASRRAMLAGLAGGVLGIFAAVPIAEDAEANNNQRRRRRRRRKRRRRRRRQQQCIPNCTNRNCGSNGCGGSCGSCGGRRFCLNGICTCDFVTCNGMCCPSHEPVCCPPTAQDATGVCARNGSTCCTTDQGGRSCPFDRPVCCPATSRNPRGICVRTDETCCTDSAGGFCGPSIPLCCPPTPSNPGGSCCTAAQPCCNATGVCDDTNLECKSGCCVPKQMAAPRELDHERQDGVLRPKP